MNKHTPTPWKVDTARQKLPFDGYTYISAGGDGTQGTGYIVAKALGLTHTSSDESEANAAHIVNRP